MKVGQRKCQWVGGGMNKMAVFLWFRFLECFIRWSFGEEYHLTIVTFTFSTFVIYVFIRSLEYWYLLLKGSTWCFAVELVFGLLQILWVLTSVDFHTLWYTVNTLFCYLINQWTNMRTFGIMWTKVEMENVNGHFATVKSVALYLDENWISCVWNILNCLSLRT